jgi:mono/diheme cytochrome c family protein
MVALAGLCVFPIANVAQVSSSPRPTTAVERGRTMFKERCATCHGEHGNGKSPVASEMKPRPTNLTTLRRSNGVFPAAKVQAAIKGSDPVVAHGAPGMLVWGTLFLADANGNEAVADMRIRDVVSYIESIQVK